MNTATHTQSHPLIVHSAPMWWSVGALSVGVSLYLALALYASQHPQLQNAAFVMGTLMATCAGVKFVDFKDTRKFRSLNIVAAMGMISVFLLALPVQIF